MKNSKAFCWFGVVVLGLVLIPSISGSVFAQAPTGVILGTVKDASGGTVAGAAVTVTNTDTNLTRTQPTGDDGAYRFPALPVGHYSVSIMKDGFQTYQRTGFDLVIGQEAVIDATLQVGSTGQTVTVTGEAPVVDTTSSTLGTVVDETKVEDLPLNGRNFVDLTLLQPGVAQTSITTGPYGMGGTMYSSNGATLRSNVTTIDGANMTSLMGLSSTSAIFTTLGIDGIKEYKVVTNQFSAEYGLATGSQSVIVSKGGSNQWHGDGFEVLRNSALDANDYFNQVDRTNARGLACNANGDKLLAYPCDRIPPFKRNNFGGSFGGPIKKDKAFFYGVYEGLRMREAPITTAETLPIGCFYGHDVAGGADTLHANLTTGFGTIPAFINNVANNPVSPNNITGLTANPFTTNINGTPTACTKPLYSATTHTQTDNFVTVGGGESASAYGTPNTGVLGLVNQFGSLFPLPLAGLGGVSSLTAPTSNIVQPINGFNYQFPFVQPSREDYEQLRLDENISSKDTAFLRYTVDWSTQNPNGAYPEWYNNNRSLSAIGTVSETHIFSPTILNQARLSFSRTDLALGINTYTLPNAFTAPNGSGTTPNPAGVLIPGRENSTGINLGSGTVGVTSYGTAGNSTSNTVGDIGQNIWQISDDVFWNKGKHAFKFGSLVQHYTGLFRVTFTYQGSVAFTNLDNFLQGQYTNVQAPTIGGGGAPIPSYITNGTDGFGNFSPQDRRYWWNTLGFYGQDDYRALSRLTLNLGFRYEFNTLPQAPAGLGYTVQIPATFKSCTVPTGQFGCAGPANGQGTPSQLWSVNHSYHNFSPRIGFAWDVFGNGKTALRGGGAIMYDVADFGTSIAGNASGDPSLSALETIAISYPSAYFGGAPIPLTVAPNCFTPTCTANSFQNLGALPCSPQVAGGSITPVKVLNCPSGMKVTVSTTARVADYNMAQPTTGEWNLTLDRQLPFDMDLTLSYVGTKAWHVMQTTEGNPTMATGTANGLPFYCSQSPTSAVEATTTQPCVTNTLNNRPNPNLLATQYYSAGADSSYNGLQASLNKRISKGMSFQVAYTYSKTLDDGEKANSDGGSGALSGQTACGGGTYVQQGVSDYTNPATGTASGTLVPCTLRTDKGPSFFDITHNLKVNVVYHIPDRKTDHFYGGFIHGWWLGAITSFQTGFPITVTDGTDRSMTSNQNTSGSRPDLAPSFDASTATGRDLGGIPNQWFNTTMFSLNAPGTFGNAPRGAIRGPGTSISNISINKDTRLKWLGEAGALQLRVELFNAFNHPVFLAPGGSLGWSPTSTGGLGKDPSGQFFEANLPGGPASATGHPLATGGVITATSQKSRQIQLTAKIVF